MNFVWRKWLSPVHSTNSICAASIGFNQRQSFIFAAATGSARGWHGALDRGTQGAIYEHRIRRSVPVPEILRICAAESDHRLSCASATLR
jgi:hypothetical protein